MVGNIHILGIVNLTPDSFYAGSRVKADIDAGSIGGFVLDKAKKLIIDKTPDGLVEHLDGKQAVLNLEAIPELKSVFDTVAVNGLSFSENAVCVDANLK